MIDYYEANNQGLDHYAHMLREKGYLYDKHFFPHDVEAHELSTGKSRISTLRSLGITATVVPVHQVNDGINAVRMVFDRLWFDRKRCERGLEALRSYRREYDEKLRLYKPNALHDWSSHGADALRYFAAGFRDAGVKKLPVDRYRRDREDDDAASWMSA